MGHPPGFSGSYSCHSSTATGSGGYLVLAFSELVLRRAGVALWPQHHQHGNPHPPMQALKFVLKTLPSTYYP